MGKLYFKYDFRNTKSVPTRIYDEATGREFLVPRATSMVALPEGLRFSNINSTHIYTTSKRVLPETAVPHYYKILFSAPKTNYNQYIINTGYLYTPVGVSLQMGDSSHVNIAITPDRKVYYVERQYGTMEHIKLLTNNTITDGMNELIISDPGKADQSVQIILNGEVTEAVREYDHIVTEFNKSNFLIGSAQPAVDSSVSFNGVLGYMEIGEGLYTPTKYLLQSENKIFFVGNDGYMGEAGEDSMSDAQLNILFETKGVKSINELLEGVNRSNWTNRSFKILLQEG